ncbi:prepilin-type N-terminal cleavage/methylation domain-containing protein [Candidatus Saccharibacteria bacterium]|nr:prepilin-type N-terminal cleavage/methylation domain-containing protein [Candidatus Saccharibacteria bacterium]
MKYSTKNSSKHRSRGFTIIELLIATTVFSMVLLVFLTAFLRISQLFYKGVNLSNTQEAAREVLQNISNDIQFFQAAPYVYNDQNYFCIGNHRYTYNLGTQYDPTVSGSYGIAEENLASCTSPSARPVPSDPSKYQELLEPGMQVNKLDVSCVNQRCLVNIHLVFYGGDNSVLVSPSGITPAYLAYDAQCSGPPNSSQYCATADYSSTILQRF